MPAVSVIVPIFNVEKYIERCARRLMGQALRDLEYIFVDDCTPDKSVEILERVLDEYPERRSQVKIIHNEVNRGSAFTRRVGIEHATGDYIIHCDSDDYPEPDMYGKMYAKASEENLDIVICRTCNVYPDHVVLAPDKLGLDDLLGALLRQDMYNHLTDKLITRQAYLKGITYPRCDMSEDTAILIQLVANCKTFGYIYEPLYNYVASEGGISRNGFTEDKVRQMVENYNLAFSALEAKGLAGKYRKDITNLKCWLKSALQEFPREFYMSIYPEVDLALLFNRRFPILCRIGHLTKLLGIHGLSKIFKKNKQ